MSVRGYADWKPQPEAARWVRATAEVMEQYRDYWPLTVRQLFYRLVASYQYEKTETAYNRLTQIISRARRANLLPWKAVRDGGAGRTLTTHFYTGADEFQDSVRSAARAMRLDRQKGQEQRIELWCEAGGMVPILSGIARPYGLQVNTGGGYDSVTAKHNLAERVAKRVQEGQKTLILHVGDFDGSGEDMCEVLREDTVHMVITQLAWAARRGDLNGDAPELDQENTRPFIDWAYDQFVVERVALTGEQVINRGVETAPAKKSDSRTAVFLERNWEVVEALGTEQISAQLEALTPPELETLITLEIEAHMDMDAYEDVLEEERKVREDLLERLDR